MKTGEVIAGCILALAKQIPLNEMKDARECLRPFALSCGLGEFFGYRVSRRPRAEVSQGLRDPTRGERRAAWAARRSGIPAHEVEQRYNKKGVKMTRNMQSRDDGARA